MNANRQPFDNRCRASHQQPNYDALADPHASFYFLNKSMKKHLLHLRKVPLQLIVVHQSLGPIRRKKADEQADHAEAQIQSELHSDE